LALVVPPIQGCFSSRGFFGALGLGVSGVSWVWGSGDFVIGLGDSVKKFVRYKHMKKLFGWGLLTISKSEDEFVKQVNAYLKDPELNHDKRVDLSSKYAYKLDGKSSQRIADFLISSLDKM